MIEVTIVEYLDSETSLTKGSNLYAFTLPEDVDEGAYVRIQDLEYAYGSLQMAVISVFVVADSYYDARSLSDEIREALTDLKGLSDGSWTSGGSARIMSLGESLTGQVLLCVMSDIYFS